MSTPVEQYENKRAQLEQARDRLRRLRHRYKKQGATMGQAELTRLGLAIAEAQHDVERLERAVTELRAAAQAAKIEELEARAAALQTANANHEAAAAEMAEAAKEATKAETEAADPAQRGYWRRQRSEAERRRVEHTAQAAVAAGTVAAIAEQIDALTTGDAEPVAGESAEGRYTPPAGIPKGYLLGALVAAGLWFLRGRK